MITAQYLIAAHKAAQALSGRSREDAFAALVASINHARTPEWLQYAQWHAANIQPIQEK